VNTMTAEQAAELADRIRARSWGWKAAFGAWYLVNGEAPSFEVHADGTRTLVRPPVEFIKTNVDNLPALGLDDVVQADGTLQLDADGTYRYEPVGELPDGFTAYQRITT
jgi:hypothetical protein